MHSKLLVAALAGGMALTSAAGSVGAVTKKTTKTTKAKATVAPTTAAPATTATPATTAAPAKASGKKGGAFVDVRNFTTGDPTTIDPALASVVNEGQIAGMLFDGLMDIDYETAELKPNVAESASLNAAGDVATFKIRKNVKFSNGEDVLPSSFKCAWDRVVLPATASRLGYHFDSFVGKKAVDDGKATSISGVVANDSTMTLVVNLTTPYADFIAETQHTVFSPLTKAGCTKGRDYHDEVIVGNGPFKLAEPWKRGQFIKMVRNDTYWGGLNGHTSYLDSVEFKIVRDELAALNLFESGTGDVSVIPAGRFNELTKKYGDQAAKANVLTINYMGINWESPKVGGFANAKLRQAISLAVNRKQINDAIFDGSRKEATGFTPPGIVGVKETTFGINPTANVDVAKKLLAEWGKPVPDLNLRCANTPASLQICAIIRNNLQAAGIDVTVQPDNPTGYFDRLRENPGDLFRSGWAADFTGYDNFMYPLFHTKSVGGDNTFRFGNAGVDASINAGRKTPEVNARGGVYYKAEQVVMEQAVVVPLYWNKWSNILSKNVNKFVQGPTAFVDYNEVTMK